MKKLKYLIGIVIICIIVFIGIEVFRKTEHEEENNDNTNITTSANGENTTSETNTTQEPNTTTENNDTEQNTTSENSNIGSTESKPEEIANGSELIQKADKKLYARGWAGASSNIIALKDNILYYYNESTGEFKKLATGIEDIYYNTDNPEIIIAKQKDEVKKLEEAPDFLEYE